jgi:glutamate 5-kinase
MTHIEFRRPIHSVNTIVVKVGSRILASPNTPTHEHRVRTFVGDLVAVHSAGMRVLVVSSGAVAHGWTALGLKRRPQVMPRVQACASVGQIRLMQMYERLFAHQGICIGQVLLTWDDLRNSKRYHNLRNTLFELLHYRAIPIINENDSVGVEEIKFGDNDTLGAQIAMCVNADLFVILTDTPGLHDANPRKTRARHIPFVHRITEDIHAFADTKGGECGVGGMVTKLKAAEIVTAAGMYAIIGDGFHGRLLDVLKDEAAGTLFLPADKRMSSKRRWLAFSGRAFGTIIVDDGARKAVITKGKSLLAAGIRNVSGSFESGDMVDVSDSSGAVFARGTTNFSSEEIERIRGCRTGEIGARLGRPSAGEVLHRDKMVILP